MEGLNFNEVPKYIFSATEIRTFSDCARKRYYSSRSLMCLKAKKPNNNLTLGSAVHAWLAHMYVNCDKRLLELDIYEPTEEDVKDAIAYVENTYPFVLEEELGIEEMKMFECMIREYKFQLIEDLQQYAVHLAEMNFSMRDWPLPEVMYHGFIDLVFAERGTNKCFFVEHKTSRDFRPEIYNRFDIQLHIYAEYGEQFAIDNNYEFGGVILNEIKKAKTERGFAVHRMYYKYGEAERAQFFNWLSKKTYAAISDTNFHEPCNNYMTCKMCEFAPVCLKYGYEVPEDRDEILTMKDEEGVELYDYDPRTDGESTEQD